MTKRNRGIIGLLIVVSLLLSNISVFGASATSYTWTIDAKRNFVHTQDAYLPDQTITTLELNKPQDLFIDKQDRMFIADTGNRQIVIFDIKKGEKVQTITHEDFKTPMGLFVTEEGTLYVADPGASRLFIFDHEGVFLSVITKPTENAYGTNDFNPMRVAVDKGGTLYILGEGIYDGIIQLAATGEFLGYFTSNKVELSFIERLQDLFFTEAQKANLLGRTPNTFSNVYVDGEGIVYTTTMGYRVEHPIKKHNTAGRNMITHRGFSDSMLDVVVDDSGIIYGASKEGYIFVSTREGEFIYLFGAKAEGNDISGLFTSLVGISVDSQGRIWTVDEEKAFIQSFKSTDYARQIYTALDNFQKGAYQASISNWQDVLRLNQMSILAHNNIGKNYLFEQSYEKSMYHMELAGNRQFYSQAFWEVRNQWLQKQLPILLLISVVLLLLGWIRKFIARRKIGLKAYKSWKEGIKGHHLVYSMLTPFRMMRHPIDIAYDIRISKQGTFISAAFYMALAFTIYLVNLMGKGFIYQFVRPEDMDLGSISIGFIAIAALFIVCNYLVTSINDGEGSLKQIFMVVAYGLLPYMIALGLGTLLSHLLTFNEVFFLDFIRVTGPIVSVSIIFIGLMELHNYEFKEAVFSIFMTGLMMMVMIVMLLIVVIMGEQLYQFVISIIKEVVRNATGIII